MSLKVFVILAVLFSSFSAVSATHFINASNGLRGFVQAVPPETTFCTFEHHFQLRRLVQPFKRSDRVFLLGRDPCELSNNTVLYEPKRLRGNSGGGYGVE